MKTSPAGIALICRFESCKLDAYLCPAGVLTIGWGHTEGVEPGQHIGYARANELLTSDLASVESSIAGMTRTPLSQCQFDALASFTFNVGVGNLRTSTLLRKLNAGDLAGAAREFPKWIHAGDQVLPGLVTRRAAEQAMFNDTAAQA